MNEQMLRSIIAWLMRTPIEGRESKAHHLTVEHLQALLTKPQQPADEHPVLDVTKEG